jgi:hypothetical protein
MTKLVAALILVALLFCVYGVKEIVEAHAVGSSPAAGYEALIVAAVLITPLVVVRAVRRRHRRRACAAATPGPSTS